jgi:hypothetical protein
MLKTFKEKIEFNLEKQFQKKEMELNQKMLEIQEKIVSKEAFLDLKSDKIESKTIELETKIVNFEQIKKELEDNKLKIDNELERIATLTKKQAIEEIKSKVEQEVGQDLINWQQKYVEKIQDQAEMKASEIVALAVQRCSSETANEHTVTTIKLDSDDDKGKIIGKVLLFVSLYHCLLQALVNLSGTWLSDILSTPRLSISLNTISSFVLPLKACLSMLYSSIPVLSSYLSCLVLFSINSYVLIRFRSPILIKVSLRTRLKGFLLKIFNS